MAECATLSRRESCSLAADFYSVVITTESPVAEVSSSAKTKADCLSSVLFGLLAVGVMLAQLNSRSL
jgi:hypothetical protein